MFSVVISLALLACAPTIVRHAGQLNRVAQQGLEAMYQDKDYDKAIKCFTKSMTEDPDNRFMYYGFRGVAYRKKGDYESAISDFTTAIQLDPTAYQPFIARAAVYADMHDYVKALHDYDAGIRLNPRHSVSYYNRGLIREQLQNYDKAIADYSAAIRLNPQYTYAYIARGNTYRLKKDCDKAITDYSAALKLHPKHFLALHNRGLAYSELEQYDMAIKDYTQAINADPRNSLGYYRLSWMLATCPNDALRNGQKALEFARKSCELSKWDPRYYSALAAAYAELRDFEHAVEWESKALKNAMYAEKHAEQARYRLSLYKDGHPYRHIPKSKHDAPNAVKAK